MEREAHVREEELPPGRQADAEVAGGAELGDELSSAYATGYFDHPEKGYKVGGKDYAAYRHKALAEVHAGRGAP